MLGLPLSAGYSNEMSADLCHPFATPQRSFGQTFGCGHSSDPYGCGLETILLQRSATNQADAAPWFPETSLSPDSQDGYAIDDSLYTKALQIAALESLTNALDYGSLPVGSTTTQVQLPYANRPLNQPLPGSPWSPLSAAPHATQHNSTYSDRTPYPHAARHDLLASAAVMQKQSDASIHAKRPHWAGPSWHPKASVRPGSASGATCQGTGVFLPCSYDEPQMAAKPLTRTHSGCSYASRDSASPISELCRIDSSFSCQSSETDCSYIAAHGTSFYSKFPAGDARRVVGSKIGTLPGKRVFGHPVSST